MTKKMKEYLKGIGARRHCQWCWVYIVTLKKRGKIGLDGDIFEGFPGQRAVSVPTLRAILRDV